MPGVQVSSVESRLKDVLKAVHRILAGEVRTKLDIKRRLIAELAIDPKPEALQAFSLIAESSDRVGKEILVRALVTHLAVASALDEAWGVREADPEAIRHRLSWLPRLVVLIDAEGRNARERIDGVNPLDRKAVSSMCDALRGTIEPVAATVVVLPALERLATAQRAGRLEEEAPSLTPDEISLVGSAAAPENKDASRPERAVLDAVAMRVILERGLAAWSSVAASDDGEAEARASGLRGELEAARDACNVVSARLDALRAERFKENRRPDPFLVEVRRRLFAAYVDLGKALRGADEDATADGLRDEILEAERAAAVVDARREATRDLIRDAASRADEAPAEQVVAPDALDLARERRRRRILAGIAATLVPVAVGTNLWLSPRSRQDSGFDPEAFTTVVPAREAVPLPDLVYTEVGSLLWQTLSESERRAKVGELGRLASAQRIGGVVVVDEQRRELARWTVEGGTELIEPRTADR